MFDGHQVLVVGAGIAGARACEALRNEGYQGTVQLIGGEGHLPYDRPPLSKNALARKRDTTFPVDYAALDVDVRLDVKATGLNLDRHVVRTTVGKLAYERLVIATGADPMTLPGTGPQLSLRTVDDADRLRDELKPSAHVVLVGAGWINAEIATTARALGCEITCIEAGPAPLCKPLGEELGRRILPWWEGIELRLGVGVVEVTDSGLLLTDGSRVDADIVVAGIGVRPATRWLEGSGIELDHGVVVDEYLRTSDAAVFAVGDVAARWSPRFAARLRGEHWDDARAAPAAAIATLLRGPEESTIFDPVPYFWSDQFGHKLQFVGCRSDTDQVVFRDGVDGQWGAAWFDSGGQLTAHLTIDSPRLMVQARMAIEKRVMVDSQAIRDLSTPLQTPSPAPN